MWCRPSPRFSIALATGLSSRVGRQQLHVALGDLQQRFLDTVALDDLAMLDLGTERTVVVVDRRLEVLDGDGDVVDFGQQHGCMLPLRTARRANRRLRQVKRIGERRSQTDR